MWSKPGKGVGGLLRVGGLVEFRLLSWKKQKRRKRGRKRELKVARFGVEKKISATVECKTLQIICLGASCSVRVVGSGNLCARLG
ncbi:hypothetical protein R1flu_012798 [Riccia fluitans]|uniref:Uncharacterized protein n=1 Tax=Riccia fluitans TaxID=41844 RepID=A0ABD1ZBZ0_9MARC